MTEGTPNHPLFKKRAHMGVGWEIVFRREFEALELHRAHAATSFSNRFDEIVDTWEAPPTNFSEQETKAWEAFLHAELQVTNTVLPRLQWNAQFLVAYATFENIMNKLCRIVERRTQQSLSVRDLSGMGIDPAKMYLQKVAEISEPFQMTEWKNVIALRELRNKIIHANGEVDGTRPSEQLLKRLQEWKIFGVDLLMTDEVLIKQILLTDQFVLFAISTFRAVVDKICEVEVFAADPLPTGRVARMSEIEAVLDAMTGGPEDSDGR